MINFKKQFEESEVYPNTIEYNGKRIFIADKFPIDDGDILLFSIESTNSNYIQGFAVDVYGSCKVLGKTHRKGKHINMIFWEDSEVIDPKHVEIQINTKKPFVYIQNVWEAESWPPFVFKEGDKHTCYAGQSEWSHSHRWNGAAMYMEEIVGGRRYRCNDGVPDDDFDDIIFTVRNIGNIYKTEDK